MHGDMRWHWRGISDGTPLTCSSLLCVCVCVCVCVCEWTTKMTYFSTVYFTVSSL